MFDQLVYNILFHRIDFTINLITEAKVGLGTDWSGVMIIEHLTNYKIRNIETKRRYPTKEDILFGVIGTYENLKKLEICDFETLMKILRSLLLQDVLWNGMITTMVVELP
ncbi:hypothetical protein V1477_003178 [Vespula maculifrons]|uniref:Uncharacterized protein n=1 Tax=Vespula maculifrons TaxID=7453 RepID=A0ABD2CTW9_VESMC